MQMTTAFLLTSLLLSAGALAQDAPAPDGAAKTKGELIPKPHPTALIQSWITVYDMDQDRQADPAGYGDPEDDPGMKLRRARLGVEGESDVLKYAVSVGFSAPFDALTTPGSEIELVDAYVGYAPVKDLWIQGGVSKPPIGREQLMSSSELALAERSVESEWLVPGRDAGVMGDWRTHGDARVRLRAGAYNGNGDLLGDNNNGKLVAGRAEFAFGPGRTYQTWGGDKGFTLGVGADGYYNADVSTGTGSAGGDLMLRVAGLSLMAEGRFAHLSPRNTDVRAPGVFDPVNRWGGLAQVSYGIGPVEPAVRFSLFDDNTSAKDNGDVAELLAGVTGHLLDDHARVGAGYVMRMEMGGATIPNDTVRIWTSLRY